MCDDDVQGRVAEKIIVAGWSNRISIARGRCLLVTATQDYHVTAAGFLKSQEAADGERLWRPRGGRRRARPEGGPAAQGMGAVSPSVYGSPDEGVGR